MRKKHLRRMTAALAVFCFVAMSLLCLCLTISSRGHHHGAHCKHEWCAYCAVVGFLRLLLSWVAVAACFGTLKALFRYRRAVFHGLRLDVHAQTPITLKVRLNP